MGLADVRRKLPIAELPPSGTRKFLPADRRERTPRHAVWEFTAACDQKCRACGPRSGRAKHDELTTDEALALVRDLADLGVGEVTLIGGEAYLRNDFILVIRAIRDAGMKASMTTGGLNLTPARAEAMAQAGIEMVSVSIDGLADAHDRLRGTPGGFARAIEALRNVRATGVRIGANTQINRLSAPDLVGLAQVLADEGIAAWQMFLTIPHGRAAGEPDLVLQPYMLREVFESLRHVLEICERARIVFYPSKNLGYFGPYEYLMRRRQTATGHYTGCVAGRIGMGIEADGAIKSCPTLGGAAHVGGHVREHALREIWERAPELRVLGDRTVDDLWGFCRTCYYAQACMGGCSATVEPLFGRPGNNPFCHHRVQTLAARGLREPIEQVAAAPEVPFGIGRFRLVLEPLDDVSRASRGPIEIFDPLQADHDMFGK